MLAESVVEILSQATSFTICHLCDFPVEALPFRYLTLQGCGAFLDTSIQFAHERPQLG
jgi:hypothetical protein